MDSRLPHPQAETAQAASHARPRRGHMLCSSRRSLSDVPTRDQIPTVAVTHMKTQAAVSTTPPLRAALDSRC